MKEFLNSKKYQVESLNGTYITSKLLDDQSVASLITHDKGMTWNKIDPPKGTSCKNSETEVSKKSVNFMPCES